MGSSQSLERKSRACSSDESSYYNALCSAQVTPPSESVLDIESDLDDDHEPALSLDPALRDILIREAREGILSFTIPGILNDASRGAAGGGGAGLGGTLQPSSSSSALELASLDPNLIRRQPSDPHLSRHLARQAQLLKRTQSTTSFAAAARTPKGRRLRASARGDHLRHPSAANLALDRRSGLCFGMLGGVSFESLVLGLLAVVLLFLVLVGGSLVRLTYRGTRGPLLPSQPRSLLAGTSETSPERPDGSAEREAGAKSSGSSAASVQAGSATMIDGDALVELGFPGLTVPLRSALNVHIVPPDWASGFTSLAEVQAAGLLEQLQGPRTIDVAPAVACPTAPARLFLGIATRCCDEASQRKRAAIRQTWLRDVRDRWGHVMKFKFLVAQPDASSFEAGVRLLTPEVAEFGDLIVVPGIDSYRNLPNKTLRLLQYGAALSTAGGGVGCNFTHILKIDDDIYFRPEEVLRAMNDPGTDSGYRAPPPPPPSSPPPDLPAANVSVPSGPPSNKTASLELQQSLTSVLAAAGIQVDSSVLLGILEARLVANGSASLADATETAVRSAAAKGAKAAFRYDPDDVDTQPVSRLFLGHRFNPRQAQFAPDRRPGAKWFLSAEELPDDMIPEGVEYPLGWGYVMSIDVVSKSLALVKRYAFSDPSSAPGWWKKLPWEDVVVGALVKEAGAAPFVHNPAFKTAWEPCAADTAIKHLDIEALHMLRPLQDLEDAGVWAHHSVPCSAGDFREGEYNSWLKWRNKQSDVKVVGRYG